MKYRYATIEVKVPDLTPDIEPNDKLRLLIGDRIDYRVISWTVEYDSEYVAKSLFGTSKHALSDDGEEFDIGGEG